MIKRVRRDNIHTSLDFEVSHGRVLVVKADQKIAQECYAAGLKLYPRAANTKITRLEVAMANLDPRTNTDDRIKPLGELNPVKVGMKDD